MTIIERIHEAEASAVAEVCLALPPQLAEKKIEIRSSENACDITALTKFACLAGVAWIAE